MGALRAAKAKGCGAEARCADAKASSTEKTAETDEGAAANAPFAAASESTGRTGLMTSSHPQQLWGPTSVRNSKAGTQQLAHNAATGPARRASAITAAANKRIMDFETPKGMPRPRYSGRVSFR